MKKFFEEYGFIILICVVIISLIGITISVKPLMADSLSDITNSWGLKAQELVKNSWDNIINNNSNDETGTVEKYEVEYLMDGNNVDKIPQYVLDEVLPEKCTVDSIDSIDSVVQTKPHYKTIIEESSYTWSYKETNKTQEGNKIIYTVVWTSAPTKVVDDSYANIYANYIYYKLSTGKILEKSDNGSGI